MEWNDSFSHGSIPGVRLTTSPPDHPPARKSAVRSAIKERIATLTPEERAGASGRILERLGPLIPPKGLVLAFEPLRDEPDIGPLVERLRAEGRLALVAGRGEEARIEPSGDVALAIVPGRAFTLAGDRLGRGGGTFDRILAAISCPRLGVAFSCQVVEALASEAHDVRVDRVITDRA